MKREALRDLYVHELRDLYSAETQMVKALPKLAKSAESKELRVAFEEHLDQTRKHVNRLKQIFKGLAVSPNGQTCKGMRALIEEGSETTQEDCGREEMDAALVAAAQRAEHYEIAGYGCVRSYADFLGEAEAVDLIERTLQEEKKADEKLTDIGFTLNIQPTVEKSAEQKEDEETRSTGPHTNGKSVSRVVKPS